MLEALDRAIEGCTVASRNNRLAAEFFDREKVNFEEMKRQLSKHNKQAITYEMPK